VAKEVGPDKNWWDQWWADLCTGADDAAALREWALKFYGLSGVEQPLDRLRMVKAFQEQSKITDLDEFERQYVA